MAYRALSLSVILDVDFCIIRKNGEKIIKKNIIKIDKEEKEELKDERHDVL